MSSTCLKKLCPDCDSSFLGCGTGCFHKNCPFNKTIEKPLYKWSDWTYRTVEEINSADKNHRND